MSKIYTQLYSNTGPNYITQGNVQASVTITSGNLLVVAVPVPSEGRLVNLRLIQTGGTSVAYTIDVLCSRKPYGGAAGLYATSYTPTSSLNLYRVLPQQSGTAGVALEMYGGTSSSQSNGFRYLNLDGDSTKPERFLYAVITPTSSGTTTTWDMALTIEHEMGL